MKAVTSRRALLKAAPVTALTIAAPLTALNAVSPTDATEWDAAMRTYEDAVAEDAAYDPIYWAIHRSWEAGRPSMDGIHWKEFPFFDRKHIARTIDLEGMWRGFLADEGKSWWSPKPESRKAQFRAALDSVQAFRDAEAAHRRDSGMDEADQRWEELAERVNEAQWALMALPAPHGAALLWKLNVLLAVDEETVGGVGWDRGPAEQALADMSRLLGREA
jgi:hypothetical protein